MSAEGGSRVGEMIVLALDGLLSAIGLVRKKKAQAEAAKGHGTGDKIEAKLTEAGIPKPS
jgi:hypothetical protein